MTTPESREHYLNSIFSIDEVIYLHGIGLADRYIRGEISINDIYKLLRDQGI